jgi:hypothetical protein
LPACNKSEERPAIIHGRIIEYGTGAPIEGARVYVFCEEGVVLGQTTFTLVDSILTDADGGFYREYGEYELCGSVSFLPYKEGYFKGAEFYYTTDNKFFTVALDPEAWLKLVTIPDLGDWSSLGFGGTFSPHSVQANKGVETQIFTGRGGRKIVLHWGPFSDPNIIFTDSIYLPPHDTTTYPIHY